MKFEKDVANLIFYMKDGSKSYRTFETFHMDVKRLSTMLMRTINESKKVIEFPNADYISPEEVDSFEITNYDELWELHLEREEAENGK